MLPNPNYFPALVPQLRGDLSISPSVPLNLAIPVLKVGTWSSLALGTAMPEATIHKDDEMPNRKRKIWFTRDLLWM